MKLCRYSNFAEGRGDPSSKHMWRGTVLFSIQYEKMKKKGEGGHFDTRCKA